MGSPLSSRATSAVAAAPVAPVAGLAALVGVGGQAVVPAAQRLIEVPEILADLLPDRGLRRGSTITVEMTPRFEDPVGMGTAKVGGGASGGMALALVLASAASGSGSWCAAVGLPELGLVAAQQLGIRLDRFALVPRPGRQWAVVTAALLDGADLLLVRPPVRASAGDARRLVARARERDAVLLVVGPGRWPEAAELCLTVTASSWAGLEQGHGYLRSREVEVAVTGRRAAARERRCRILLPGPDRTAVAAPPGPP